MAHKPSRLAHRIYSYLRPVLQQYGILKVARAVFNPTLREQAALRLGLMEFDVASTLRRYPSWNASRDKRAPYRLDGINFLADFESLTGLGEAARATATALQYLSVPLQKIQISMHRDRNNRFADDGVIVFPYSLTILLGTPADFGSIICELPEEAFREKYVIAIWYWELPELPRKWHFLLNYVDELWVASRYIQNTMKSISSVPVICIPPPINVETGTQTRQSFSLPEDRFVFLFSFSPASSIGRKNPLGVIEAFQRAFGGQSQHAMLVIKTHFLQSPYMTGFTDPLRAAIESVGGRLITDDLSRQQMNDLLNICDCYVSLHRSEGLGLGMIEAMALGKPVIATAYSGNQDYMTPANSYPVKYHLRAITPDDHQYQPSFSTVYTPGQLWADPDLDHAAALMQQVIQHPAEARQKGSQARIDITNHFNNRVVSDLIASRLQALTKRSIQ